MQLPNLEPVAEKIRKAARLTILTGAGVSAASGVPTFRGAQGLWRQFRPEDLANIEAFHRDPVLVWEWYAWRRERTAPCQPNAAHEVLARWSQREGCAVVTQNVDDLHVRAGTRHLTRLHGSLWELRCASAARHGAGRAGSPRASCQHSWRDERVPLPEIPPRCPQCGELARPDIVWFGETLRQVDVDAATAAARCDLFITAGTSALVYPAAGLVHEARRAGAVTVEINPEATPASSVVDEVLAGRAEEILPALDLLVRS